MRTRRKFPSRLVMLGLAVAAAIAVSIPAPSGAAVRRSQIDKAAVVRVGVPIEDGGGVYLDPAGSRAISSSSSNRLFLDLIYDTMIHNTADGKGVPGLATKWSAPDANTVELTLRDGVKFADGTPFNATAVTAAWDRVLASGRPNLTPNVKAITSVEAPNGDTVRQDIMPFGVQFPFAANITPRAPCMEAPP